MEEIARQNLKVMSIFISNRISQSLPKPPIICNPSLDMPIQEKVTLKTVDGDFEVDVFAALQSVFFKNMIEIMIENGEKDNMMISLEGRVSSCVLDLVIQYCTKYINRFYQDEGSSGSDEVEVEYEKEWRAAFHESWGAYFDEEVDQPTLFQLILAADFLMIRGLVDVACERVAEMIEVKTASEICKFFNIKNDLTPEKQKRLDQYVSMAKEL